MKTDEFQKQDENEVEKLPEKRVRKNKAEGSKTSKASNMTRRRQQPDSSEQCLLPQIIPQSSGTEPVVTEGFENELTKVVIAIPYAELQMQKFQNLVQTRVYSLRIIFSIYKQLDNVTVLSKIVQQDRKMEVQNDQQIKEPALNNNSEKIQESSLSQVFEEIRVVNMWGKYVYLAGYEPQNKGIKKVRKQLSGIQYRQIVKFKIKNVNSDLFIFLNIKLQEYQTSDYKGLVNQGNTCYMNSYLQTLYHIPAFRNLVYEAEIQQEAKFPATLQQLFFNLGTSEKAASPETLVKSFGWGKKQASVQQDAQEFSCLFFEALQRKLNDSSPKMGYKNRTIEALFKGSLNHYIRCANVGTVIDNTDFRNENYEEFIDLQLSIFPTLTESLDAYTSQVHLEGDNAYSTDDYGKQEAYKGVKIGYLPPILMIQLKRFGYNYTENKNIKILSAFQYQDEVDFSRWSTSQEKQIYQLYAVLVHEGSKAQSGHYYNFVKIGEKWYKFNDQVVQEVDRMNAFEFNFGGFYESLDFDTKQLKVTKKFIDSKTTAYMLVYIKKSQKEELMRDQGKLPEWIQKKNVYKLQLEVEKKNKKNFFHNVGYIDWEVGLQSSICSDIGFLDEYILQSAKKRIPQIPKEATLSDWLVSEKIIEQAGGEQKKKKQKKSKPQDQEMIQSKQPGIYVFYVTDRQLLTGFVHKNNHKMTDLLKVSPDPIIIKFPFQAKKDEYVAIIKHYKVERKDDQIHRHFYYHSAIPIRKDITYSQLSSELEERFSEKSINQKDNQMVETAFATRYNFYIDDIRFGTVPLSQYSGLIPAPSPKSNQLLVCIVEQITVQLTIQEEIIYSFPKYYIHKKNMVELTISEERSPPTLVKKQVHGSSTLSELRNIIFQNLPQQKKEKYGSAFNIIIKAKLKKGSKIFTEVAQPQYNTVKDITKIDWKIEFCFSSLTVQSRLLQFQLQVYYRSRDLQLSSPVKMVLSKSENSEELVRKIKHHPLIVQMIKADGFTEDQAQMFIMNKSGFIINDVVSNEGKVVSRGEFQTIIKKQRNSLIVVEGRNQFVMQNESKIQINEEQADPIVNLLIHHVSNNAEKIGVPRYFKVDRRMQLTELRTKILDLIKDQVYHWQEKFHICHPFDVVALLYGKDTKKVIQLNDLDSLEEIKRAKAQQKAANQSKRKKSKQIKSNGRKQSTIEEIKEPPLETVEQISKQEERLINHNVIDLDKEEQKQKASPQNKVIEISDDPIEKDGQPKQKDSEQDKDGSQIEEPNITQIEGPQTIYGVFPKQKVLKVQIIHGYLTKPNVPMRLNVYD